MAEGMELEVTAFYRAYDELDYIFVYSHVKGDSTEYLIVILAPLGAFQISTPHCPISSRAELEQPKPFLSIYLISRMFRLSHFHHFHCRRR
jgi:hypothetical protein